MKAMDKHAMANLAAQTQAVYERNAARFDRERPKVFFEKKWMQRFQALLPAGGKILDVGCGAGEPIAAKFIENGYDLTGVDFSTPMLDIARSRFPNCHWHRMDMRELALGERFDGIIAWHSFFHLTQDEQRKTLRHFADHLVPGGALMLTVGHEAGEVTGHVGDDPVYHSSLSIDEYAEVLRRHDIDIVEFSPQDPDCDGTSILLARKAGV